MTENELKLKILSDMQNNQDMLLIKPYKLTKRLKEFLVVMEQEKLIKKTIKNFKCHSWELTATGKYFISVNREKDISGYDEIISKFST